MAYPLKDIDLKKECSTSGMFCGTLPKPPIASFSHVLKRQGMDRVWSMCTLAKRHPVNKPTYLWNISMLAWSTRSKRPNNAIVPPNFWGRKAERLVVFNTMRASQPDIGHGDGIEQRDDIPIPRLVLIFDSTRTRDHCDQPKMSSTCRHLCCADLGNPPCDAIVTYSRQHKGHRHHRWRRQRRRSERYYNQHTCLFRQKRNKFFFLCQKNILAWAKR